MAMKTYFYRFQGWNIRHSILWLEEKFSFLQKTRSCRDHPWTNTLTFQLRQRKKNWQPDQTKKKIERPAGDRTRGLTNSCCTLWPLSNDAMTGTVCKFLFFSKQFCAVFFSSDQAVSSPMFVRAEREKNLFSFLVLPFWITNFKKRQPKLSRKLDVHAFCPRNSYLEYTGTTF